MNPLTGITSSLTSFFQPEVQSINSFFDKLFHPNTATDIGYISRDKSAIGAQNASNSPTPTLPPGYTRNANGFLNEATGPDYYMPTLPPSPQGQVLGSSNSAPSANDFLQGFNNYSPNLPIASQAGLFSQAAQRLPANVDKFLPAIISLMETSGGQNMSAPNNFFNTYGTQNGQNGLISYPNLATALLGGNNSGVPAQGFVGNLLNNPAYQPYLNSGNLSDFFNVYTPPGAEHGNPTLPQLMSRYNTIRGNFK